MRSMKRKSLPRPSPRNKIKILSDLLSLAKISWTLKMRITASKRRGKNYFPKHNSKSKNIPIVLMRRTKTFHRKNKVTKVSFRNKIWKKEIG